MKKKISLIAFLSYMTVSQLHSAPLNDELVVLHNATTTEMNAITSPTQGSLIFNIDESEVYERNATAWHRISSDGSETKIVSGNCMEVLGTGTTSNPYIVQDKNLGETQTTAGLTCKQILDNGCNPRDGVYWINPDGGSADNAFEVYCDMSGGGWTKIAYANDLTDEHQFGGSTISDAWRWLPNNFSLVLSDTQINNIRAVSTEGKQRYVAQCDGVLTYYFQSSNNYTYAFGYRLHTGFETNFGQQNYTGISLNIPQDGCRTNRTNALNTIIDINDTRIPIINVYSRDNGGSTETFGSPLTNNPAWFR